MAEALAKNLVRAVARAFYDDDAVILMDAMCRNQYLLDHDLGGKGPLEEKFSVGSKQLRKTLQLLYEDCLIEKFERVYRDPRAEKGTRKKLRTFWYINYLHFCKLVRLRLHFMVKTIDKLEQETVNNHAAYSCPTCLTEYDLVTAMGRVSQGGEFYCERCYLDNDEMRCLVETKTSASAEKESKKGAMSMKEKFKMQMSEQKGIRDGIMEILHQIETFPRAPPTNLPSDHIENAQQEAIEEAANQDGRTGGGGVRGADNAATYVDEQGLSIKVILPGSHAAILAEEEEDTDEIDYAMGSLPEWMSRDVNGKISTNAIQDKLEREAKRRKTTGGKMAVSKAGGAAELLAERRRERAAAAAASGDDADEEENDALAIENGCAIDSELEHYEATTNVQVIGESKALKDITVADQDLMTDDEYFHFFRAKQQAPGRDSTADDQDDLFY